MQAPPGTQRRTTAGPLYGLLVILFLVLCPNGFAQGDLFGGVEICENFITAGVIQISNANNEENVKLLYNEVVKTPASLNGTTDLTPDVLAAMGLAIQRLYSKIEKQYQVPTDQIYLIAGSELKAENPPEIIEALAKEIKGKTGRGVTFLPIESEIRLGVVSTIPRRYAEGAFSFDNRSQSIWFEIGGAAVKGGYQQYRQPLIGEPFYDFVSFRAPHRDTIAAEPNSDPARAVKSAESGLDRELSKRPGLLYRKKIYLSGEIVWALATVLHPENRRPFVPVTPEDIKLFLRRAQTAPQSLLRPDLSRITKLEARREVERELQTLRSLFPPDKLLAGAEILNSVADQCRFQDEGKSILFTRFNQLSMLLTYLRLESQKKSQPRL
jgi:hypothetical protein